MPDLYPFILELSKTGKPEHPTGTHDEISRRMWQEVRLTIELPVGARVLDVGCGQGVGLKMFHDAGLKAIGITNNTTDWQACKDQGFDVALLEMHKIRCLFWAGRFEFVWIRHTLEHSPAPMWVLRDIREVLIETGYAYIETPAPGTDAHHEANPNHYSIFGAPAWSSLIERSGFEIIWQRQIEHVIPLGRDVYFAWLVRKKDNAPKNQ